MKSILAIAAAAAAVSFGVSAASAQECENGYFMLRDSIPVACGGGANGLGDINGNADEIPLGTAMVAPREAAVAPAEGVLVDEPQYTGSVRGAGNASEIPSNEMRFVDSRDNCQPGLWYMQDMQSMNFPARCP